MVIGGPLGGKQLLLHHLHQSCLIMEKQRSNKPRLPATLPRAPLRAMQRAPPRALLPPKAPRQSQKKTKSRPSKKAKKLSATSKVSTKVSKRTLESVEHKKSEAREAHVMVGGSETKSKVQPRRRAHKLKLQANEGFGVYDAKLATNLMKDAEELESAGTEMAEEDDGLTTGLDKEADAASSPVSVAPVLASTSETSNTLADTDTDTDTKAAPAADSDSDDYQKPSKRQSYRKAGDRAFDEGSAEYTASVKNSARDTDEFKKVKKEVHMTKKTHLDDAGATLDKVVDVSSTKSGTGLNKKDAPTHPTKASINVHNGGNALTSTVKSEVATNDNLFDHTAVKKVKAKHESSEEQTSTVKSEVATNDNLFDHTAVKKVKAKDESSEEQGMPQKPSGMSDHSEVATDGSKSSTNGKKSKVNNDMLFNKPHKNERKASVDEQDLPTNNS